MPPIRAGSAPPKVLKHLGGSLEGVRRRISRVAGGFGAESVAREDGPRSQNPGVRHPGNAFKALPDSLQVSLQLG